MEDISDCMSESVAEFPKGPPPAKRVVPKGKGWRCYQQLVPGGFEHCSRLMSDCEGHRRAMLEKSPDLELSVCGEVASAKCFTFHSKEAKAIVAVCNLSEWRCQFQRTLAEGNLTNDPKTVSDCGLFQ